MTMYKEQDLLNHMSDYFHKLKISLKDIDTLHSEILTTYNIMLNHVYSVIDTAFDEHDATKYKNSLIDVCKKANDKLITTHFYIKTDVVTIKSEKSETIN